MQSNRLEISTSDIHLFYNRFINSPATWSYQRLIWQPKKQAHKLTYCRKKPEQEDYKPLGLAHIRRHIQPESVSDTLSVAALDEVYCCKWACWDLDANEPGGEVLVDALKDLGLNPIREAARADRFGHVWLFFDEPIPALELTAFSRALLSFIGLNPDIEFFPKQSTKDLSKIGLSSVRLPLGIHNKPGADGARGWFEDVPRDIATQLAYINSQPYDSARTVKEIGQARQVIEHKEAGEKARQKARETAYTHTAASGVRELVNLLDLIPFSDLHSISSDWYATRCPACAAMGRDSEGRHLNISKTDGTRFKCWRDGIGCASKEIIAAFTHGSFCVQSRQAFLN